MAHSLTEIIFRYIPKKAGEFEEESGLNKSESKYFNTAVKMDKAFLDLLEHKDFEYITVKEICKTANVNPVSYTHLDVYKRQMKG